MVRRARGEPFVPQTYHPGLVVLSCLIAVWASYDALRLAGRTSVADVSARPIWLIAGALAMGIAIWSMHFVAMLALHLPVPVSYSVPVGALSVVVSVGLSAVAFTLASRDVSGGRALVAGAVAGVAISGMHFTAMAAMRLAAAVRFDPILVALAVAIAIVVSGAALRLAFGMRRGTSGRGPWLQAGPALLMGGAIVGMHYTAMAAAHFTPAPAAGLSSARLVAATPELAIAVTLGTAAMLAMAELGVIISRREAQVREGEQRFRLLVNEVQDYAIFMLDPAGRVVSWNAGAERLKRYRAEEILGEHYSRFYLPEEVAQGQPERQLQIAATQGRAEDEGWRLRRDGSRFRAHVVITAVHDAAGALVGFTKVTRDVTELRQTEAELAQYRGQLQALAARIESAQEEERSRIAREIHDELGQALTILKLDLGWLRANLPRRPAVSRRIRAMDEILDRTLDALRRLAADLRPTVLDQLGLSAGIRSFARDFEARTGVRTRVNVAAPDIRLDRDLATTAYRIFQEALTNVARHAGARRVDIALHASPEEISLEVRDDGRGISEQELASPGSLGLLGMRERARSQGGDVLITGTPGRGTIVRATLPRRAQVRIAG